MSSTSAASPSSQTQGAAAGQASALPPLKGVTLAVTAIALAIGTFMQVLDGTIANVSIPTISGNLGVSTSQGAWVITSFAIANGVSVPLTGWLMGRYGIVKTFVGSVLLFTIASFLCGISWDLPSLIFFRIVQGGVSGPMIPGSQALLIMIFPASQRGAALALWSMTTLVAPVCGPILGGYISDNFSWAWIFLINVPIGAACVLLCWRGMAGRETPTRKRPIDSTGFMLLLIWVGALQAMLDTGKDADWFNSAAIVAESFIALVGFVAWLIWELTDKNPMVDLTFFRSRNFTLGTIVFALSFGVFFGNNLLLPLWLQTRVGYAATWAGLVAAPAGLVAVLLTPMAARLISKVDARWTATLAMAALALSYWMRSGFTADADFGAFALPMLVQGAAMSTFFISLVTIVLNGVPPQQIPSASGLNIFCRLVVASFAASLTTTLQDRGASLHQTRLAEEAGSAAVDSTLNLLQHAGAAPGQAIGVVGNQFVNQSYLLSTLDLFRLSAWICIAVIPLIWLTDVAKSGSSPAAAAD